MSAADAARTGDGLTELAVLDGTLMPLGQARLPATDAGVARGDGAFETVGVWDGVPFALDAHFERLQRSLALIGLDPVDLEALRTDVGQILEGVMVDAALRIYATASRTRLVTLQPPPVRPLPRRLAAQEAQWISPLSPEVDVPAGRGGPKTMSYLPNMAASRRARREGADDALLVSAAGTVLEGPTFALMWVAGDRLHAPDLDLGIVDSISRRALCRAAGGTLEVVEGRWPVSALAEASEILAVSSLRDVVAVRTVVGIVDLHGPTPLRDALAVALWGLRRGRSA